LSNDYPVVVYGASGYTGRLVMEHLRELGVPFVAAGRNRQRVEESLRLVPGIESARYEIAEVEHTVAALTKLLSGRKVICNTVGPFARYNLEVAEACLRAGIHYLDTTAEQHAFMQLEARFDTEFAKAGLVMIPSTAYMYAVSEIGARHCLETPGVDSLRLHSIGSAVPTVASAQTIFDAVGRASYYLKDRQLVRYPSIETGKVCTPSGEVLNTSNWGGTTNPLWFRRDGRVRNCKMDVAMWNQDLHKKELELERAHKVQLQWIPEDKLYPLLDHLAKSVAPAQPPRESRQVHRSIDVCLATGNNVAMKSTIFSTGGYLTTGALQAYAASRLAVEVPRVTGLRSPSEVLGHRELMGALKSYGYASIKVEQVV
jgi:NAD(P)-dependent dehydrogenase (short-subunit alcohol dehydrogenase family)